MPAAVETLPFETSLPFETLMEMFDGPLPDYLYECVDYGEINILYKYVPCEAVYRNTRNSKWRAILWMPERTKRYKNIPKTWMRLEFEMEVEFGEWCDNITLQWDDEHIHCDRCDKMKREMGFGALFEDGPYDSIWCTDCVEREGQDARQNGWEFESDGNAFLDAHMN